MQKPTARTVGFQKGPLMHFQIKRTKGHITVRLTIGSVTITLDVPL